MSYENVITVDFDRKKRMNPETGNGIAAMSQQRLRRLNEARREERMGRGLPDAGDLRSTMSYAVGLYHLVRDSGSEESISECQSKVSELLLTLTEDELRFFGKLVRREIGEEELTWVEYIDAYFLRNQAEN